LLSVSDLTGLFNFNFGDTKNMPNVPDSCASPLKPTMGHIQECQDQQRQAFEHLLVHLRQKIAESYSVAFNDGLKECARRSKQLESAFELFKQAEAKVQILISWCGGGQ
jgi:hypothetical protein